MPNGVLFVDDSGRGMLPKEILPQPINATSTCVMVACMHEQFGKTNITLGPAAREEPDFPLYFDGIIATPNRLVSVSMVPADVILEERVPDTETRIRVWRDHPQWPQRVVVGWG
jgi:hypothetical protein